MQLGNILALEAAWQRAVREHAAFMRDAKSMHLSANEIHTRGRVHLLRIDLIFAKLKLAEERNRELTLQQSRPAQFSY